jgi:6-phosphogluconolactonase
LKNHPAKRENEMTRRPPVEIFSDRDKLIHEAAEHVVEVASRGITDNARVAIALSGGSTPRHLYTLLASEKYSKRIDWSKVDIFWGDERCVPPDNPQSNYWLARETLLDAVPIPVSNVHRIHGEQDPEKAAAVYEKELRTFFGANTTDGSPRLGFDLILLGMGDNGHTASLFPGSPAVNEKERWVMEQYVEVVSMWRITLTPVAINAAKNVIFIVSGVEKAERLHDVLEGPFQPEVLPAQIVKPARGRLLWLVDKAAASRLERLQQAR